MSLSLEIRWNSEFWTSPCVFSKWFLCYTWTRGLPWESERSVQLQAFDVYIIYSCCTHRDVGGGIFAQWGNGLFAWLPDITPKTGDYSSSVWFGASFRTTPIRWDLFSLSLCLSPLLSLAFVPTYSSVSFLVLVARYPELPEAFMDGSPGFCMRRWIVSLWKAIRESNKMERKYDAPSAWNESTPS